MSARRRCAGGAGCKGQGPPALRAAGGGWAPPYCSLCIAAGAKGALQAPARSTAHALPCLPAHAGRPRGAAAPPYRRQSPRRRPPRRPAACACRDVFHVGALYLGTTESPEPRAPCNGKGALKKDDLAKARINTGSLECALLSPQGACGRGRGAGPAGCRGSGAGRRAGRAAWQVAVPTAAAPDSLPTAAAPACPPRPPLLALLRRAAVRHPPRAPIHEKPAPPAAPVLAQPA